MARTYRITIRCHHANGVLVEPNLHYQTDVPIEGSEPDPGDVAGGVWDVIGTAFRACMHQETMVDEVIAAEEVVPPAIGVAASRTIGLFGSNNGDQIAISHANVPLFNRHTNTRSRSARGWFFMSSPLSNSVLAGNNWTNAYQTTLGGLAALLDNTFQLGSIIITHVNPVVYSRQRHHQGLTPYTFTVTKGSANPEARWLKSRLSSP